MHTSSPIWLKVRIKGHTTTGISSFNIKSRRFTVMEGRPGPDYSHWNFQCGKRVQKVCHVLQHVCRPYQRDQADNSGQ